MKFSKLKFLLLPDLSELSKFQREEYAGVWFDLAKLSAGSMVFKAFEPGGSNLSLQLIVTILFGLTIFLVCIKLGLYISEK